MKKTKVTNETFGLTPLQMKKREDLELCLVDSARLLAMKLRDNDLVHRRLLKLNPDDEGFRSNNEAELQFVETFGVLSSLFAKKVRFVFVWYSCSTFTFLQFFLSDALQYRNPSYVLTHLSNIFFYSPSTSIRWI